jgi:hypothetical protein
MLVSLNIRHFILFCEPLGLPDFCLLGVDITPSAVGFASRSRVFLFLAPFDLSRFLFSFVLSNSEDSDCPADKHNSIRAPVVSGKLLIIKRMSQSFYKQINLI